MEQFALSIQEPHQGHKLEVCFSSKEHTWGTPQPLFDALNKEFCFTLDVSASEQNTKCPRFFSVHDNALRQRWEGVCWMNPPYGKSIGKWLAKAAVEAQKGATVVCLVPAKTDTVAFHEYVYGKATEVRFIRGRLKFNGAKDAAPFPSMIVVYTPRGGPTEFNAYEVP